MHSLFECVALSCIFGLANSDQRKMEGFVVLGNKAKIESFPYIAFMSLRCENDNVITRWRCGASILNQEIFLSAAHCFDKCQRRADIILSIGHVHRLQGKMIKVKEFRTHQHYRLGKVAYDIALVKAESLITFNKRVSRVAIMSNPPYFETAYLPGWGYIDEIKQKTTDLLHYIKQQVMDRYHCSKILKKRLPGTFCAQGEGYASLGDSGSPLIVRGYIQIGIVSYKNPHESRKVVVYTDVGHYYNWIVKNAKELLCK